MSNNFNRFLSNSSTCCTDNSSSYGGTVYNKPITKVLGTDGDVVLYPSMAYNEYIFTSGTTQNFLTNALVNLSQSSGYFIKVKNGKGVSGGDIAISINGVFAGTIHPATNQSNAGTATLYWNGTNLFFY